VRHHQASASTRIGKAFKSIAAAQGVNVASIK
jgi:hypothetical protein